MSMCKRDCPGCSCSIDLPEINKQYKHKNCLDSHIRVCNYWIKTNGDIGLTVRWYTDRQLMMGEDDITIKMNEWKNWVPYVE